MTDETTVTAWMTAYLKAWDSNEPDDIRAALRFASKRLDHPFIAA